MFRQFIICARVKNGFTAWLVPSRRPVSASVYHVFFLRQSAARGFARAVRGFARAARGFARAVNVCSVLSFLHLSARCKEKANMVFLNMVRQKPRRRVQGIALFFGTVITLAEVSPWRIFRPARAGRGWKKRICFYLSSCFRATSGRTRLFPFWALIWTRSTAASSSARLRSGSPGSKSPG